MQRFTAVFLIARRLISWTNHFDFGPIIEIIFTQIWNLAENFEIFEIFENFAIFGFDLIFSLAQFEIKNCLSRDNVTWPRDMSKYIF